MGRRGRKVPTGTRFGQVLAERDITIRELELATGINKRFLSDYANGQPWRIRHLTIVSAFLDVSPNDLRS
jgi:hypothetical protein